MANDFVIPDRRGLVGEWLLNGDAKDTSGNNYNGTPLNVTYSKTDRCYQTYKGDFNGTSSSVSMGNVLDETGANPFHISVLMKFNSVSVNQMIFGKQMSSGSFGGYMLWGQFLTGPNRFRLNMSLVSNDGTFGAIEVITPNNELETDKFYKIDVTYDGSKTANGTKIFINGILKSTTNIDTLGTKSISTSANLNIGSRNGTLPVNGSIQSVRIFNRALSETEIRNWYLESLRSLGGSTLSGLMDGVVAYYDFRGDANDIIGGNDGTVSGATLTTDSIGNPNSAYSFNRAASNYISCGNSSGVTGTKLTVEFTVKAVTYASPYRYVCEDTTVGTRGWEVAGGGSNGTNARIFFSVNGTENLQSSTDLIADSWHHVVCTFDGSTKTIYVDGIFDGSQAYSGSLNAAVNPLQFGRNVNGTSYSYLDGKIGFVRVFNVVKTSDQVKALSQLSSKEKLLTFA